MREEAADPAADDAALAAAWAEGRDARAFACLVGRHEGLLRRAAFVALGAAARRDPLLVDDAVQEACVRLVGALARFRGDSAVATFMAAVARRAALDELRKAARRGAMAARAARFAGDASAPGVGVPPGSGGDPAAALERREASERVAALLAGLPEPERSLVYLRDAEGASLGDLARAFGLREGTVKSKLARARAKLRGQALAEWGDA
ncbi:MAG: sigma-70 family RNA polymerase sigma factor [Spirochaetales bacterium]|nr:sigma-70 family RNA polymerase sigma factor [Spirochaetales bacterium]